MKALLLTGPGQPFEVAQVPDPVAGAGDAVAKVIACGAGLTIQHMRAGRVPTEYPRIIGHEITAEIVEVGSQVRDLKVGDPVTAYYYLTCGTCEWCRKDRETLCENMAGHVGRAIDGGYAEYIKLPANSFIKIPDSLDYRSHPAEVGVVTDAIATPLKVTRKTRLQPEETVAVIGGGGGLGIQMVRVAKWAGAKVIAVDVRSEKFAACRESGADAVLNPAETDLTEGLNDLTQGRGVDVLVDFVASDDTLNGGLNGLAKGGRLIILGGARNAKPFSAAGNWIKSREIEILGSLYATRGEVADALELVARGEVWPLVTETCALEDAEALHERVEQGLVTGRAAVLINDERTRNGN